MEKRQSQIVRIKNLEKTVTQLYLMVQAILDKLSKDEKDRLGDTPINNN